MKIKSLAVTVFLSIVILCFGGAVGAQVDNSALIAQLQAQIAQLQAQIQALLAQQNPVAQKVLDYINNNGLSSTPASLVSSEEVDGLIKVTLKIGVNQFDSYATKNGKFLFPQVFDMTKINQAAVNSNSQTQTQDIVKTSNPVLEAYVVSRCPYGLQMQRAMADAVQSVPELAQYLKARYIGSASENKITAMHGEAEATENLRQICIREEQPNKYWNYVACQMKNSGTETSCESPTGIDSPKLSACMLDPLRGVAYAKIDFDLNTKYNISGSPTLILNGTQISETQFGGRSSDAIKSIVCAGFDSKPSFCSQKLNTTEAATSFSLTYGSSGSNSSSGSGCH